MTYVRIAINFTAINSIQHNTIIVTGHEKIGLMCTQNLTTFLNFKLQ